MPTSAMSIPFTTYPILPKNIESLPRQQPKSSTLHLAQSLQKTLQVSYMVPKSNFSAHNIYHKLIDSHYHFLGHLEHYLLNAAHSYNIKIDSSNYRF